MIALSTGIAGYSLIIAIYAAQEPYFTSIKLSLSSTDAYHTLVARLALLFAKALTASYWFFSMESQLTRRFYNPTGLSCGSSFQPQWYY
mmetsp:Transcript_32959/g.40476  ORF Transcript_32959/g.40476 Transcript_32959/m.40476 type:complete len:89 (-) Transcript_32959:295-561(-)